MPSKIVLMKIRQSTCPKSINTLLLVGGGLNWIFIWQKEECSVVL
jgi:hypothetical protein